MILSPSNIKKTVEYLKRNGVSDTYYAIAERISEKRKKKYTYNPPTPDELKKQEEEIKTFKEKPLISIVVPAYETKPVYLEDLILSCQDQSYTNFEIIIADASKTDFVERIVKDYNSQYGNIIYKRLTGNNGISENTNEGLLLAKGDYIGLLDHDDVITPDALFHTVKAINECFERNGNPILVYSDEDKSDEYLENFYEPYFKSKADSELIMSNNYICHFSVFKADVIKELKLRSEYDGAQDYDLILRCFKYAKEKYADNYKRFIVHVPKVLYHWRCHSGSTAENPKAKDYAYEAGLNALKDFVKENESAVVNHLKHKGFYRVDYDKDIFDARPDVIAVGGTVIREDRIVGGLIDKKGNVVYGGLNSHFSGYMHGAVLKHEADILDIRNMIIRPGYENVFKEETGYDYPLSDDIRTSSNDEMIIKRSEKLCNKLRRKGVILLYDPQFDATQYYGENKDK